MVKPSTICKEAGFKSLKEVAKLAKVSPQTLINWHKNRPDVFKALVEGLRRKGLAK